MKTCRQRSRVGARPWYRLVTLATAAACCAELVDYSDPRPEHRKLTPRQIASAQATLTQNLYTGGKVSANVNRSKNQVMAERATLIAQEQTSFNNAVSAYVGVIQAKQLLDLQINNEQVLAKQLEATNDRFPGWRDYPDRCGAGRSRPGGRSGNAGDGGRQSTDRPWHISADYRCVSARRSGGTAAVESPGEK